MLNYRWDRIGVNVRGPKRQSSGHCVGAGLCSLFPHRDQTQVQKYITLNSLPVVALQVSYLRAPLALGAVPRRRSSP